MGLGEAFALASAAVWAVAVIAFKRSGETMPPFPLNLFKNVLTLVLLVPTVLLVDGPEWPILSERELLILVVSGVIGVAIADTLYFQALNAMGAGRTGIVASLFSPSVILLSFLFLGERLTLLQGAGFLLVLGGVLLVSFRQAAGDVAPADLRRGVLLGALSVFLMAVGIVMVKTLLETRPFLWVVTLRMAGGVAGMLAVMVLRGRTRQVWQQYRAPHDWRQIIVASIFGTYLAILLWLAGYKYTLASIASVLNETSSVFIVLLAWLVLREPLGPRKLAGVGLTFSGVLVMVLG